ncbi:MAG: hypothetical protein I8H71_01055 [Xanthomonadaceae bacterium]|nr:hypothetical protein [Xanthomonadaceae bacterium]
MAALPSYARVLLEGAGEEFDPGVVVSEMEKGLAKMRVTQSRVVVDVPVTLFFRTQADTISFDDWYFNTIKRIGFFDWRDPRGGQIRSVRFKDADIGKLTPLTQGYEVAKRDVTLQYLR